MDNVPVGANSSSSVGRWMDIRWAFAKQRVDASPPRGLLDSQAGRTKRRKSEQPLSGSPRAG
jgi:hypothetical protein